MSNSIVPSIIKSYQGKSIRIREDKYVCLTDMASASGKQSSDWTRLKKTQELELALSTKTGIPRSELIVVAVSAEGDTITWAHPKLSIQFAQWCSAGFALQVSDWIDELMTTGKVELVPAAPMLPADYLSALKALVEAEQEKQLQAAQIEILKEAVDRQSEVIDELFDYSSIIRIAKFNKINPDQFTWSQLKAASKIKGLEVKKAPCAIWGTKNLYSHDAWRLAYPGVQLPDSTAIQILEAK